MSQSYSIPRALERELQVLSLKSAQSPYAQRVKRRRNEHRLDHARRMQHAMFADAIAFAAHIYSCEALAALAELKGAPQAIHPPMPEEIEPVATVPEEACESEAHVSNTDIDADRSATSISYVPGNDNERCEDDRYYVIGAIPKPPGQDMSDGEYYFTLVARDTPLDEAIRARDRFEADHDYSIACYILAAPQFKAEFHNYAI